MNNDTSMQRLSKLLTQLGRRLELASLQVDDIQWLADGSASVLLRRSKTDQQRTGKWIHVTTATGTALRAWVTSENISNGLFCKGNSIIWCNP